MQLVWQKYGKTNFFVNVDEGWIEITRKRFSTGRWWILDAVATEHLDGLHAFSKSYANLKIVAQQAVDKLENK